MRRKHNLIPKLHLKKDDNVRIISGDDKGKTGRIIAVFPEKRRIMVEGVNIVTKHTKPTAESTEGGRITKEASIHISNAMLADPKTGGVTRIGKEIKADKKGIERLVRVNAKTREVIK